MGIANTLGHFIDVEKDFHLIFDKRMARVLVKMDIMNGISVDTDILYNDTTIF